ncbi:SDR family NAD(P)-dependent oxidoreductase [Sedimentitalea arenosa]|uniref:SDR family NAD(P)-dependent oxidoreductase n=1 Tax=Sedimentitalea arenosa TaxID=2798803 RepID=A0A8J7J313_9RHOB|nr:SDR family NAD(P)-dependent oxidoreductase [Arenibacterium arenosum]MBJ6372700.1 SDR family NAD(P)-dependent oxidoreductase [Arenibacterium arenosum]
MQKSILITGCSSGIGLDAARTLRDRDWRVFAACRQQKDCDRLIAEGFDSPRVDYCDAHSIRQGLAQVLAATGGTLDALFNNGAHQLAGLVEDLPTEGLRAIFEANLFGWHDLTRQVIPVMRRQGYGHIAQCSSGLGLVAIPWRGAYTATKHALEGLSDTMRVELRGTGIHVVLIEPGPITTMFREKGIPYFERYIDWKSAPRRADYEARLIPRMYNGTGPDRFELPASAVTGKLIRALDSSNPNPRYYVTTATYIGGYLKRILSSRMIDRIVARI